MSRPSDPAIATVVQSRSAESRVEGAFTIIVVDGPDKGLRLAYDDAKPSRVLIGQSPTCDLRLTDREVSRRHAALEIIDGGLRISDLGSTNGTFVDRVKVREADLLGGEMIRLGSTQIAIDLDPSAQPVALTDAGRFGRIWGASREMRRIYPLCERLASSHVPVVIEGETGTGKEVLAEALHEAGPRASGPFVVFDCTASPPSLVESELFGHERGAFTGALASRKGVFEQAHGGTLLIDEIGDLDLAMQPKLLRAIERSEIRRLGGERWTHVDVRILAATRRDLDREVQAGRFRDDLFHRIAVARVELPPLRNRRGDIPLLAHNMWLELGGDPTELTRDTIARWEEYTWPGNVRELRNTVARRHALGEFAGEVPFLAPSDPTATSAPRPDAVDQAVASGLPFVKARENVVHEFERRYVAHLLAMHGGDVARAATASGIGRRYFQVLRARNK